MADGMTYSKPTKKGPTKAPPPRSRLPDQDEHDRLLDRARSEKDRREIERMRDVIAAARKKLLR
jgi:hypothetical protein